MDRSARCDVQLVLRKAQSTRYIRRFVSPQDFLDLRMEMRVVRVTKLYETLAVDVGIIMEPHHIIRLGRASLLLLRPAPRYIWSWIRSAQQLPQKIRMPEMPGETCRIRMRMGMRIVMWALMRARMRMRMWMRMQMQMQVQRQRQRQRQMQDANSMPTPPNKVGRRGQDGQETMDRGAFEARGCRMNSSSSSSSSSSFSVGTRLSWDGTAQRWKLKPAGHK